MTTIIVALIGVFGVVVGTFLTALIEYIKFRLQTSKQNKLDIARKKLLKTMLNEKQWPWRKLETLKQVIGADEDTTIRLLIELEARGSEDGQPLWGLISKNPFPDRQ
jgi:hypothetical protein